MLEQVIAEFLGTMFLILLGNGVVAGCVLKGTKSFNGGWIVITLAWGLAVFVGVIVAGPISGAHLNPAVSISLAIIGTFSWSFVPFFIVSQILGAMMGQLLVWAIYSPHYAISDDTAVKLATFCTSPAIKNKFSNFTSEFIGTLVLIFSILMMHGVVVQIGEPNTVAAYAVDMGALGGLPVSFVVVVIGLSLGGTTGYAINPARDFGPRLVHWLLPIQGKGESEWCYAWLPIVAPVLGAIFASLMYMLLLNNGVI